MNNNYGKYSAPSQKQELHNRPSDSNNLTAEGAFINR